jgi:hypothetical protein
MNDPGGIAAPKARRQCQPNKYRLAAGLKSPFAP